MEKLSRTIVSHNDVLLPTAACTGVVALFVVAAVGGLSPLLPNLLIVLASIALFLFLKPIACLYLLLLLSLFQNILGFWFESLYVGTWRDILTIGILGIITVKFIITKRGFWVRTPITGLLFLFAALIFVQIFNPALPSIGMGIFGFRAYFVPMLGFFIGLNFITSRRELKRIGLFLLVFLSLAAVVGIIQAKMGFGSYENLSQYIRTDIAHYYSGYSWYRVSSIFGTVWEFGNLMSFMILLSLPLYNIMENKRSRTLLFLAISILFTGLIASAALSSIYSACLGICVYAVLLKKRKFSFVVASIAAISLSAIYLERVGWERVILYFFSDLQHQRLFATIPFHEALVGNLKSNFLGKGMGISLDSVGMRFGLSHSLFMEKFPDLTMEGDYFMLMNQAGFPGMILLIIIHVKIIAWARRIQRLLFDTFLKSVAFGISILMISAIVTSLFRTFLAQRPLDLFIWIATGLLFSLPRLEEREREARKNGEHPHLKPHRMAWRR